MYYRSTQNSFPFALMYSSSKSAVLRTELIHQVVGLRMILPCRPHFEALTLAFSKPPLALGAFYMQLASLVIGSIIAGNRHAMVHKILHEQMVHLCTDPSSCSQVCRDPVIIHPKLDSVVRYTHSLVQS